MQEAWRKEARFITVIRTEFMSKEEETPSPSATELPLWLREPLNHFQHQLQHKWSGWRQEWNEFLQQQKRRAKEQKKEQKHLDALNGGRWLFGLMIFIGSVIYWVASLMRAGGFINGPLSNLYADF